MLKSQKSEFPIKVGDKINRSKITNPENESTVKKNLYLLLKYNKNTAKKNS